MFNNPRSFVFRYGCAALGIALERKRHR